MKVNVYRESDSRCDKFTIWVDKDGIERQGFIHDTGRDVLYQGRWLPVYETPEGEEVWG